MTQQSTLPELVPSVTLAFVALGFAIVVCALGIVLPDLLMFSDTFSLFPEKNLVSFGAIKACCFRGTTRHHLRKCPMVSFEHQ